MFPHTDTKDYIETAQKLLTSPNAGKSWNSDISKLFKTKPMTQILTKIHNINMSIGYLKQLLSLALITCSEELFQSDDLIRVFKEQSESGEPPILAGLTLVEKCLLIAIKHILVIYDGQPFNFEMVHHELDKFVSTRGKMFKQERGVVMKAWETLIDLELINPVDRGTKIQKEFKLHNLQIFPEMILKVLDSGAPQSVQEWAQQGSYA